MKKKLITLIFIVYATLSHSQEVATAKEDSGSKENTLICKSYESFQADFKRIGKTTNKWDDQYIKSVTYDVIKFAEATYVTSVDITLLDLNNTPIKATKYVCNPEGETSQANTQKQTDWPNIKDSSLAVILNYSSSWHKLSKNEKQEFMKKNNLKIGWIPSDIDLGKLAQNLAQNHN